MNIQIQKSQRLKPSRGFSLLELLITVAVLGIMVSIALTSFTQGQRDVVLETVHRRNAQALGTIAECAQLAGVDPVQGTDVTATIRKIVEGVTPPDGAMKGRIFRLNGLTEDDVNGAAFYLKISHGKLEYEADKPIATH